MGLNVVCADEQKKATIKSVKIFNVSIHKLQFLKFYQPFKRKPLVFAN
jgi:hypothetical protein